MQFETELEACLKDLPGCVGAGYVDLESGFMLAMRSQDPMPEDQAEVLAVAAVQALNSATVAEMCSAFGGCDANDTEGPPPFRETVILSETAIHVFQRVENYPDEAVCLIFDADCSAKDVLAGARERLKQFSETGLH